MFAALRNGFRTPPTALRGFAAGLHLGVLVIAWIWWFIANWGTSPPVAAAMILVTGSACVFGLLPRADEGRGIRATHREAALRYTYLTAWTVILPLLTSWSLSALRWVPLTALASPAMPFCLALVAATVTLGPALYFAGRLAGPLDVHASRDGAPTTIRPSVLSGIAVALCASPLSIGVWWGMQYIGWGAAAIALCYALWSWRAANSASSAASAPAAHDAELRSIPWLMDVATGILSGAALCAVSRMTAQLVTSATYVPLAQLAAVMAGAALGVWFSTRRRSTDATAGWLPLIVAGTLAGTCALFPWLVRRALDVNAYVVPVWQALPLRAMLASACLAPLGFVLGGLLQRLRANRPGSTREVAALPLLAVIGSCAALPFLPVPLANVSAVVIYAALAVAAPYWWSLGRPITSRPGVALAALACAVVACGPLWLNRYDPALSARALFSPPTTLAYRTGTRFESLSSLDDGRLLATLEGEHSTWTIWKHHSLQLQLRENGVPRYLTSLNPAICPQSSAEVVPAVLPLVIHPAADHVLLAGLGSTTTLDACLAFPVRSVTCIDADRTLARIAHDIVVPRSGRNPFQDPRLRCISVEPALAAAAADARYDVVILNDGQAALSAAAPRFTSDYYARWAGKLNDGGLLCQRFQYVDYSAGPLRNMFATLQSIFRQVAAFETAPGELLLIATRSDQPLVDTEVLHRAEARHVRRVMSQLGWDWSVLLALTALDAAQVREIAADPQAVSNSSANGRFAFALAPEVMRGGPKLEQVRALLAGRNSRMLAWLGDADGIHDVAERLADVTEQQRVIQENPDGVWAYRKSIKQRLQERPRTAIVQVAHEGLHRKLHPEDQRRKDYLVALGAAATNPDPPRDAIDAVVDFVEPYDPLVSYFAHHEAARLLARSTAVGPRAELDHRLHTIYFNAAYDRSVRNVVAALEIVLDHPETAGAPLDRWDQMNSLLEVLKQRWSIRVQLGDASRYADSDAEQTLAVAQRALETMERLTTQLPLPPDVAQARLTLLERQFVRPLRTYRAQHAATRRRAPSSSINQPAG